MANVADIFTKYNCTNCQEDIVHSVRVHCAECENFDLCLQCFSTGAEIGSHQNTHAYQFMDTGTAILSVFRGKGAWTAREEIRLLDAIEQFGFGNWEDISKHIETKTAEEAKEEYVNKFVNGTIGRHTWTPAQSQRPTLVDHTTEDTGPLGVTALQRLPPLDITSEEASQLGYMPNRDGFEREYDPTAEQLISTMSLNADDTEADYLLKLAHVDMYTRRLRERNRRKRLVRDYQLVANFFRNRNYAQHPGMTREQKEFRDRFRVFAQFYTANEYERLLASLEREKELRIRLAELCRYRYNGLTKIDECRHFEQHAAMALHRSTGPYGHGKTDNTHHSTGSHRPPASFSHSPLSSSRKPEMSSASEANSSSIVQKSMHHIDDPICSVASSHSKNYSNNYRASSAHTPAMITATTTPAGMIVNGETSVAMTAAALSASSSHKVAKLNRSQSPAPPPPPPLQQLYMSGKNPLPQLELNDVALCGGQSDGKQQLLVQHQQENNSHHHNESQHPQSQPTFSADPRGSVLHAQQQPQAMSKILRGQLDELKQMSQPLGNSMLSSSEQQLCKVFNLSPTTYLTLKTVLLSDAPVSNLTHVERSLRKYFIKVGWLSH